MTRTATALAVVLAATSAVALSGCETRSSCEQRGGKWREEYVQQVGTVPAHWETTCTMPRKPTPKPSIVTGVAGPGTVVLRFRDGGKPYLKIRQAGGGRRVVQQVPAAVYDRCREGADWPRCAE